MMRTLGRNWGIATPTDAGVPIFAVALIGALNLGAATPGYTPEALAAASAACFLCWLFRRPA